MLESQDSFTVDVVESGIIKEREFLNQIEQISDPFDIVIALQDHFGADNKVVLFQKSIDGLIYVITDELEDDRLIESVDDLNNFLNNPSEQIRVIYSDDIEVDVNLQFKDHEMNTIKINAKSNGILFIKLYEQGFISMEFVIEWFNYNGGYDSFLRKYSDEEFDREKVVCDEGLTAAFNGLIPDKVSEWLSEQRLKKLITDTLNKNYTDVKMF